MMPIIEEKHLSRLSRAWSGINTIQIVLFLFFFSGGIIYYSIAYYSNMIDNMIDNVNIYNLTEQKQETHYKIGISPICGDQECWISQSNNYNWDIAYFPNFSNRDLKNYKLKKDNWIYYRIKLKIPPGLRSQTEPISFSPVFIRHKVYDIFINGKYFYSGSGKNKSNSIVIPLPNNEIIENGTVTVFIKGSFSNSYDSGLAHKSVWLLGVDRILSDVHLFQERATLGYHSIFVLIKVGIFFIISLFFFKLKSQKGLPLFLPFVILSIIESILIGSFLDDFISPRPKMYLTFYIRSFAFMNLFFFLDYYLNKKMKNRAISFGILLIGFLTPSAIYLGIEGRYFGVSLANDISYLSLSVIFSVLLVYSIKRILILRKYSKGKIDYGSLSIISLVLFSYLLISLYYSFLKRFDGFDFRSFIDVAFFIYISYMTVKDLSIKAKKLEVSEKLKIYFEAKYEEELNNKKDSYRLEGTVKTAEIFAHDIRNYINSTMSYLQLQEYAKSLGDIRTLKYKYVPIIKDLADDALNQIQEFFDSGSSGNPNIESIKLEFAIHATLKSFFSFKQNNYNKLNPVDVWFEYRYNHAFEILADLSFLQRSLTNLIKNASEAMTYKGTITFETKDIVLQHELDGCDMFFVELRISNLGCNLSEDDARAIFNNRFTKGKIDGTGIGLTSVVSLLSAMDTRISSDFVYRANQRFEDDDHLKALEKTNEIVLIIQIPASQVKSKIDPGLLVPKSLDFYAGAKISDKVDIVDDGLFFEFIQHNKDTKIKILIIDDEEHYSVLSLNIVKEDPILSEHVVIETLDDPESIENVVQDFMPDIIFMDIDLGDRVKSGFRVNFNGIAECKRLRDKGFNNTISFFTNRDIKNTDDEFIQSNADLITAKPMSRDKIVKALNIASENNSSKEVLKNQINQDFQGKKLYFVDDNLINRKTWEVLYHGTKAFSAPGEFFDYAENNIEVINRSLCVVLDNHFNSEYTGVKLGHDLREIGVTCPIYLFTGDNIQIDDKIFDGILPKKSEEAFNSLKTIFCIDQAS